MSQPQQFEWDRLREEILQSESTRSDLLKWKLVIVGTLSGVGLGLAGAPKTVHHADLVLCAVPLVSLYVDLLAYHLTLRILVIGTYFRKLKARVPGIDGYEAYAEGARTLSEPPDKPPRTTFSAFDLEDWALSGSTRLLSAALGIYGIVVATKGSGWVSSLFLISGLVGLAVTHFAVRSYDLRCQAVEQLQGSD